MSGHNLTIETTPGDTARLGRIDLDEGGTGTFTLKLDEMPGGVLTVGLQNQGLYDVTVSPPSLTFYNTDYDMPQTVTVTAVDDSRVEDQEDHQIRLNLSLNSYSNVDVFDSGYFGSMVIRITDNDDYGLHLLHVYQDDHGDDQLSGDDTVQITEGETLTKLISLASAPVDAEIVTVTYTPSAGAPFTISPTTPMMFTSSNWQNTQPLVISPTDDDDSTDDSGSITVAVISMAIALSMTLDGTSMTG